MGRCHERNALVSGGRRLPLSPAQIDDVRQRWRNELDLAEAYNVPVAVIRHVRSIPAEALRRLTA